MKNHNLATRATSLVLALELFFAPAAMAHAADPLLGLENLESLEAQGIAGSEREEGTPEGGSVSPENPENSGGETGLTPDPTGEEPGQSGEETGGETGETPDQTGVKTDPQPENGTPKEEKEETSSDGEDEEPEEEQEEIPSDEEATERAGRVSLNSGDEYYHAVVSPGIATDAAGNLTAFDGILNYELEDKKIGPKWIFRNGVTDQAKDLGEDDDGNLYFLAPYVGRVPDMEFDGFYALSENYNSLSTGTWCPTSLTESGNEEAVRAWEVAKDIHAQELTPATQEELKQINLGELFEGDLSEVDLDGGTYETVYKISSEQVTELYKKSVRAADGFTDSFFPIAARWKTSSKNDLTGFSLTTKKENTTTSAAISKVYTANPRGNANREADAASTAGDKWWNTTQREFYIMVDKDQATLDLTLTTYEPYYRYLQQAEAGTLPEGSQAPVSVQVHFDGKDAAKDLELTLEAEGKVITQSGKTPSLGDPNTAADPARAEWTVKDIPLTSVTEAADKNEDPFTTVTITVTAPDGENQINYTLYIERRTDPEFILGYGNTPVGLIRKDKSGDWGSGVDAEANKAAMVTHFVSRRSFSDMSIKPTDNGVLFSGTYEALAWNTGTDKDLDLNENAVVAYLDSAFDDPGVSFVDSEGTQVVFGTEQGANQDYQECVTRTIRLKTADKLTAEVYTTGGTDCWYTVGVDGKAKLSTTKVSQIMAKADGSDLVDLRGLKVVPGIYEMVYTFTDPTSSEVLEVKRPLVVLPIPGDADMDGAVTVADAELIKKNDGSTLWGAENTTNAVYRLLHYRVNNVKLGEYSGSAAILQGFQPQNGKNSQSRCDYYYPALPATGIDEAYPQKTWKDLDGGIMTLDAGDQATLEMKFLGKDTGEMDLQGHTNGTISGPWNAISSGEESRVTLGDIFWVGVYLNAGELAGKEIQDLALTLTYDTTYVKPVAVYKFGEDGNYREEEEKWSHLTLYRYNQDATYAQGRTLFSGKSSQVYDRTGSTWQRDYASHYSKVVGTLVEKLENQNDTDRLKELVYTLRYTGGTKATLKDGYLLVVPFQLVGHPANVTEGTFIELSAGMRDITLVTEAQTMAFSAQSDIFGGATENLREKVSLNAQKAAVAVPLGENKTVATVLKNRLLGQAGENAKYDVAFESQFDGNIDASEISTINAILQPYGLEISAGIIVKGTPTKATGSEGVSFELNGRLYQIVIEKKTISYTVDPVDSYYGESEYRGEGGNGDFTFTIPAGELSQADRTKLGVGNSGVVSSKQLLDSEGQALLAGYTAPTLTARESRNVGAKEILQTTSVAETPYPIMEEKAPKADNYLFLRTDTEGKENGLTLHPRPIWVKSITANYFDQFNSLDDEGKKVAIYNTQGQEVVTFALDEGKFGQVELTYENKITGGQYGSWKLSTGITKVGEDKLTLTFSGMYTYQDGTDPINNTWFNLTSSMESREITRIGGLKLTGQTAKNYELIDFEKDGSGNGQGSVQGVVLRRDIVSITITQYPQVLLSGGVYVGDAISSDNRLRLKVQLSNAAVGDYSYEYDGEDLKSWNLHYNWVTKEQKELGEANPDKNVVTVDGKAINVSNWDPTKTLPDADLPSDPQEKAEAIYNYQDLHQYNGVDPVTADMDGMYICMVAQKGDGTFVKVYSDVTLTVKKRALRLTPVSATRFYGEENGTLTYKYDYQNFSNPDQDALRSYLQSEFGYSAPKGTQEELEGFLQSQYSLTADQLPKLVAATAKTSPGSLTEEQKVTAATSAGGADKYVLLYGGECPGYDFYYYSSSEKTYKQDFGDALMRIDPRPVIVEKVFTTKDGNLVNDDFATIYADAYYLKLEKQVDGQSTTGFQAQGSKGELTFKLPASENGDLVYYDQSGNKITRTGMTLANTEAIFSQTDMDKLSATYCVTFVPDEGHADWSGMGQNYFKVEAGKRPVEITDLVLSGSSDYILVYEDSFHGQRQAPADAVSDEKVHPNPTNEGTAHLIYGEGNVVLRPIESMKLTSPGRMDYTYGETFAPGQTGSSGHRFQLEVTYDTRYGENPAGVNTTSESVTYSQLEITTSDGNGNAVTTTTNSFAQRGFKIYYSKLEGLSQMTQEQIQAAITAGQIHELKDQDALYPALHDGATLFITGKRGESDPLIISKLSDETLKVEKAQLTLTGTDVHRLYGETSGNAAPSFTFPLSQLAQWDLARLGNTNGKTTGTADELQTALRNGGDDGGFTSPTAATTYLENPKLDAYTAGNSRYAEYPLNLTFGGSKTTEYDNYVVTVEPGKLYVYPRPIAISEMVSSSEHPVYTLYKDSGVQNLSTQLSTRSSDGCYVKLTFPSNVTGSTTKRYTLVNPAGGGVSVTMPVTGEAFYRPNGSADVLDFDVSLIFDTTKLTLNTGTSEVCGQAVSAEIKSTDLRESSLAKNYTLVSGFSTTEDNLLYGAIKLRTIQAIYIHSLPTMEYTYSEPLDLSGLTVRIVYSKLEGEDTYPDELVTYSGPAQFKSKGLYVNYYPYAQVRESQGNYSKIVKDYPSASGGDHITIAASHETDRYGLSFSANGQYLIVSAFQEGDEAHAVQPKIIGSYTTENTNNIPSYEGTAKALVVNPLPLTYDLSATDKTYDGTTATAGTLTLTNVYQSGSVTDAIYVPIGASYEGESTNYQDYAALTSRVQNGKISFTTGSYTKTSTGVLSGNDAITWAANYSPDAPGLLRFNFVNPNVHYKDYSVLPDLSLESYWRANQSFTDPTDSTKYWDRYPDVSQLPVEVTNMDLKGPDAKNYTWSTEKKEALRSTSVTLATRSVSTDGQASAPFATIHKANRSTITDLLAGQGRSERPGLLLDTHTNALRFDFLSAKELLDQAFWNNNNSGVKDDYQNSQLHFEYALFYEKDGSFALWAGEDGSATYQDTLFFGGETVTPIFPSGYEPDPDQLPDLEAAGDSTTLLGQVYPWLSEDNGKSALGYQQGSGMTLYEEAYPGGASFASHYTWYYYLLQTRRTALPRDTIFYPIVRLAETHNYNPSAPITADSSISSKTLLEAVNGNASARTALMGQLSAMTNAANQAAQDHKAQEALAGEGKWTETEPGPVGAGAVKTFVERIDLRSVSKQRNKDDNDTEYLVETLEAVWFTDTLTFEESKVLDGVVYNNPTRYYGYYWDNGLTTALNFKEAPFVDLSDFFDVTVKDQDGNESTITVNRNHNATIYVNVTSESGNNLRKITIVPSILYVRLGDAPFQLELVTVPERPSERRYRWTTSDASVATVDEKGLVTFRGLGECTITVTAKNGKSATMQVIVSASLRLDCYEDPIFNFHYDQPWEQVDGQGNFRPGEEMTRGQVALLLDKFLNPEGQWQATHELAYMDIREGDRYYEALCRLTGAGVVNGIPGGRFAPEQPVTRAEFSAMIARMLRLNLPEAVDQPAFVDVTSQTAWAWDYIEALAKAGVSYGVGGGYFAPDRVLTREESAVILARLLVTTLDPATPGITIPGDITPENWSYQSIVRAVNAVVYPD